MKKYRKVFIVIGSVITLIGIALLYLNVFSVGPLELYSKENNDSDHYQLIIGKLNYNDQAIDTELNVSAPSSILIRDVEMVQYYKEGNEAKLVLANHQLDSFEIDGKKYENPNYDQTIRSEVFYTDTYIFNGSLRLDENLVDKIVYDESFKKTIVTELNDCENEYGLIANESNFVNGNDEWELGDIKVTYSYIDFDELGEISVIGKVTDNLVDLSDKKAVVKSSALDYNVAKTLLNGNTFNYLSLIIIGIMTAIAPYVLKKKK